MDRNLREVVETRNYDALVATPHDVDVFTATLRQTEAVQTLKAGTVLALSEKDDKYVILGTNANDSEVLVANAILAEDVETSTTADINATAFRQGHFNRKALIVKSDYTLSNKDIEKLRSAGIYLETEI
ncbi:MAG: head decoration protein [Eubacterium sp.]|nr:head decoration protein [Eubacterium sp.]